MAAKPKTAAPAKGQLNTYSERLAKFAKRATASVAQNLGGKSIGTAGGQFEIDGQKTDEFEGIILDSGIVKAFYEGAYNPNAPSAPTCYATGRVASELVPHENVKAPLAKTCAECKWNKFNTALVGKGKRCKDTQRIHILKENDITSKVVEPYTLSVPPTSLKAYANYAKGIEDEGLALQVVKTTFHIEKDPKAQFLISFGMSEELDADAGGMMLDHADKAGDNVLAPFPDRAPEEDSKPSANKSKIQGKPAASRARSTK